MDKQLLQVRFFLKQLELVIEKHFATSGGVRIRFRRLIVYQILVLELVV